MLNPYIYSLFLSFILTAATTPFFIVIMRRLKIIDDPKRQNHPGIIHKKPVPRGGGIPLLLGVLVTSLIFLPLNNQLISIFVAAAIALTVGFYDDKRNAQGKDLSPYFRFLVNILCAVIVVSSGVRINFITNPFGEGVLHLDIFGIFFGNNVFLTLADLISVIWIVWVMNMLNWSKGVDGQMPGIVGISAVVIGLLSLRLAPPFSTPPDAIIAFAIAGSSLGFLLYNFSPAKIFPGYGATSVYLILASISILSSAKLATAILVMGIPTIDAVFTVFRRILTGKSPFLHDNLHLHHLLLRIGLSTRVVALCYWMFSAIVGAIALTLESKSKIFALIMLVVVVGGGLLFLHYLLHTRHEKTTA